MITQGAYSQGKAQGKLIFSKLGESQGISVFGPDKKKPRKRWGVFCMDSSKSHP